MHYRQSLKILIASLTLMALNSPLCAANNTWVSGATGDDANPCSLAAPCKTFAGCVPKTFLNGQMAALDAANYGNVTLTQAVTVDGTGTNALVTVSNPMGAGITVAAATTDVVILRNLCLNGLATTPTGVQVNSVKQLIIEGCTIFGFTGSAINIALSAGADIIIKDSVIIGGTTGININSSAGTVQVSLSNVSIQETTTAAIDAHVGTVDIYDSEITLNTGTAILGEGSSQVNCTNNLVASNGTGFMAMPGATVRISNNDIFNNTTGIGSGGGIVATANNNREAGSTTSGSATTSIILQ
jgi:hypothetical protein